MSTEIGYVKGVCEISTGIYEVDAKTCYEDAEISLTMFWGGEERGKCLQISISNLFDKPHIQLTSEQVRELRRLMNKLPLEM